MRDKANKQKTDNKSAVEAVSKSLADYARNIGRICPEDAEAAKRFSEALRDPERVAAFLGRAS